MKDRLTLLAKGFLMGAADVIPGVSGGTVALIVGIYTRLVYAIQSIGPAFLASLLRPAFWRHGLSRLVSGPLLEIPDEAPTDADDRARHHGDIAAFVVLLFGGIGLAVFTMVGVIPALLDRYPEAMSAFFFGLVLASAAIPFRMIREREGRHVVIAVVAAILTYLSMGLAIDTTRMARGEVTLTRADASAALTLPATTRLTSADAASLGKLAPFARPIRPVTFAAGEATVTVPVITTRSGVDTNLAAGTLVAMEPAVEGLSVRQAAPLSGGRDTSLAFIFAAGAIAICAMILPGVSGSFLLLMLGQYGYILHRLRALLHLGDTIAAPVVGVFLVGITVGILAFSRVLHRLLRVAHGATMAALTGLMVGSLRRLWPFRTTDGVRDLNVLPDTVDGHVAVVFACFVVGLGLILGLGAVASRRETA